MTEINAQTLLFQNISYEQTIFFPCERLSGFDCCVVRLIMAYKCKEQSDPSGKVVVDSDCCAEGPGSVEGINVCRCTSYGALGHSIYLSSHKSSDLEDSTNQIMLSPA
ncbi:hypothetical protein TNCV_2040801 [Trichonephila clavipes]|nr:hypothetical protein TNCV_2040801 [Trichonephila clavipes]